MKSKKRGKNISKVEVLNISTFGIWLLVKSREYFLPFKHFPRFRGATLSQVQNVELHHGFHLFWPDLDVDLRVASLTNLEKYSLVFK